MSCRHLKRTGHWGNWGPVLLWGVVRTHLIRRLKAIDQSLSQILTAVEHLYNWSPTLPFVAGPLRKLTWCLHLGQARADQDLTVFETDAKRFSKTCVVSVFSGTWSLRPTHDRKFWGCCWCASSSQNQATKTHSFVSQSKQFADCDASSMCHVYYYIPKKSL